MPVITIIFDRVRLSVLTLYLSFQIPFRTQEIAAAAGKVAGNSSVASPAMATLVRRAFVDNT